MGKENYPQVYLEEGKYKVKKINTPWFINIKLELDSESDLDNQTQQQKINYSIDLFFIKNIDQRW